MCLNLVLLLVSVAILLLNGGHFAQEINFTSSPNPGYHSGLAMLSFVVFAIFAYGGIEAVGGLVDKTEKPEKNFAKGIVFAAIVKPFSVSSDDGGRLVCAYHRPFYVSGLYRRVFYVELFTAESHYSGDAKSVVARADDDTER